MSWLAKLKVLKAQILGPKEPPPSEPVVVDENLPPKPPEEVERNKPGSEL